MEEWMLNDLLECSVCLERLDISSRVLPCQHTFCKKCLEEILTTHKELRCPECRILVPTKIEDLPPNVLLMRILEGMKNVPRIKPNENQTVVPHQPQSQEGSRGTHPAIAANIIHAQPIPTEIQTQQQQPQFEVSSKNPVTLHQPCAKALYDYEAQEPGDLSFKKGDIIILKKRVDANWYHGEKNSNQGYFPATYVQVLIPLPNAGVPQCVALYDFKMSAEDEKDCLTFNKGAVVTVIRRVDENWAEGRLTDRIGIFPISFVEMNSAAKHLMKSSMNFQPGPSRSAPALPVTNNLHNSLNLSHSLSSSTPTSTTTTSSESSPSSHAPSTVAATRVHTREKRLSLNVNQHQHQSQHHRRSADISNRNRCFTSPASPDSDLQPLVSGVGSPPPPATSSTASTFVAPPALYIALYPYKPQKADELELRKGALYTVSEKCQDGWYKGTSVRTQKVGVFPGNYVQAVRSQPHPHGNPPPPIPNNAAVAPSSNTNVAVTSSATAGSPVQATVSPSRHTQSSHPPPKLPPRALSPLCSGAGAASSVPVLGSVPTASYKSQLSSSTSSSASVPAAVVARLATTPAPAPALSPRATTLISPPPNVAIGAEAADVATSVAVSHSDKKDKDREKDKERSGVSLMKRLTSRKKSSPPLLHPFSIDNPVFEDGYISRTSLAPAQPAPVHVRSGSCPSQLLQVISPERVERVDRERDHAERSHDRSRHSMGGSQRVRSNKHRPNILPAANLSIFTRSSSAAGSQAPNGDHASANVAAAAAPASSSGSSQRSDKDKRTKHPAPAVTERFRCITAYPPNSEYELELRVGDVVYVHKKRDDGWYKGTLQRSGKTGLFPASFVEAC